jgi:hypothetical protein
MFFLIFNVGVHGIFYRLYALSFKVPTSFHHRSINVDIQSFLKRNSSNHMLFIMDATFNGNMDRYFIIFTDLLMNHII